MVLGLKGRVRNVDHALFQESDILHVIPVPYWSSLFVPAPRCAASLGGRPGRDQGMSLGSSRKNVSPGGAWQWKSCDLSLTFALSPTPISGVVLGRTARRGCGSGSHVT